MNSALKAVAERVLPNPILHRLRARQALNRGDNPELALLPRLEYGGIFIDVGANLGDYTRVACLHFREVVAFEPNPIHVQQLRAESPKNVTVVSHALSDTVGEGTLYLPKVRGVVNTGLGSLDPVANAQPNGAMEEIKVLLRPLDSFGARKVDLIKIDVEGHETGVLRGAVGTLRRDWPALIVEIEDRFGPGHARAVFGLLADMGYLAFYYLDGVLHDVPSTGDVNRSADGRYINNFLFLHANRSGLFGTMVESNGRIIAPHA